MAMGPSGKCVVVIQHQHLHRFPGQHHLAHAAPSLACPFRLDLHIFIRTTTACILPVPVIFTIALVSLLPLVIRAEEFNHVPLQGWVRSWSRSPTSLLDSLALGGPLKELVQYSTAVLPPTAAFATAHKLGQVDSYAPYILRCDPQSLVQLHAVLCDGSSGVHRTGERDRLAQIVHVAVTQKLGWRGCVGLSLQQLQAHATRCQHGASGL